MIALFTPLAIPMLRIALAVGYVWFGALAIGVLVPWVCAVMMAHLAGTFLVDIVQPALLYVDNPLVATLEGEFLAKNLV